MTCLHTGCNVMLVSTYGIFHGDLFMIGGDTVGVMVLNHTGHEYFGPQYTVDWIFHDTLGAETVFIDSKDVIVITSGAVSAFSEQARRRIGDFHA